MKLTELDVHRLGTVGLAFLCPCCKREYLTVFWEHVPYADQREMMKSVVTNVDAASWVPAPSFNPSSVANEDDLERITIRPMIDARAVGHALVDISRGDVSAH